MSHLAAPSGRDLAVVRYARWPAFVGVALLGAFEAGLLYGIGQAVVTGRWSINDTDPSTAENVVGWGLAFVFAIVVGLCLPLTVRMALAGRLVDRITATELVETVRGRESSRVDLATADRITYLPALRATWQRSGSSADTRMRWTTRGVGHDRIVVEGPTGRIELSSASPHWADVVNALERWTTSRPELIADEPTRALLSTTFPRPHPWWQRWSGPLVCCATALALLIWLTLSAGDGDTSAADIWLGLLAGSVFVGLLVWFVIVRPIAEAGRGLAAVVVHRDPWAFFDPDEHGRYNWLLQGRGATLLRAPAHKTTLGLVWRYPYVAIYAFLPVLIFGAPAVRLWLLLH